MSSPKPVHVDQRSILQPVEGSEEAKAQNPKILWVIATVTGVVALFFGFSGMVGLLQNYSKIHLPPSWFAEAVNWLGNNHCWALWTIAMSGLLGGGIFTLLGINGLRSPTLTRGEADMVKKFVPFEQHIHSEQFRDKIARALQEPRQVLVAPNVRDSSSACIIKDPNGAIKSSEPWSHKNCEQQAENFVKLGYTRVQLSPPKSHRKTPEIQPGQAGWNPLPIPQGFSKENFTNYPGAVSDYDFERLQPGEYVLIRGQKDGKGMIVLQDSYQELYASQPFLEAEENKWLSLCSSYKQGVYTTKGWADHFLYLKDEHFKTSIQDESMRAKIESALNKPGLMLIAPFENGLSACVMRDYDGEIKCSPVLSHKACTVYTADLPQGFGLITLS